MDSKAKVMAWVDLLPNVTPELQQRVNLVRDTVEEATTLAARAAELNRKAEGLRAQAYQQSLSIEAEARGFCTLEQIEQAKQKAG